MRTASEALLALALLCACGGQTSLELQPPPADRADATGATAGTGAVGPVGTAGKGAVGAGGKLGTGGGSPTDAAADRSAADAAAQDSSHDRVCTPLDPNQPCGCPTGDWFVEVRTPQASTRLTAPHVLKLHCTEDAPVAVNNGCNDILRLSACAGPTNQASCFYLAVSATHGFVVGFLKLDAQVSYQLSGGSINLTRDEPPVREGAFVATAQVGSESVAIEGSFRVCAAPYGR